MKWKIINNGFSPQFKCGALGAGEVVSGWLANAQAEDNVSRQLRAQQQENQKNRDWQTQQAELDRQFQASQQNVSFGQQQQLHSQQQQYNLQSMAQQAKYNSPVYQRQQLEAAGINPQVYFGQNASFSGSSAQSGGAPSAPSPANGAMPGSVSGLSPVSYQPKALDIAAIGSAMKSFAEAKKLGVETDWLPRTLQADIMNKKSYADLNTALKLGAQINNEIQNAKVPYSIKQAAADLAKTISEAELNDERKLTEKSQQRVNESLQNLNASLKKLNDKEYERYGIFLHYYENMLQEQLNNLRADIGLKGAQTEESYSGAGLNRAQTIAQDLSNAVRKHSLNDEMYANVSKFIAASKLNDAKRQQAYNELQRLRKLGSAYDHDGYLKFDAALSHLFEILGLKVSLSGSTSD